MTEWLASAFVVLSIWCFAEENPADGFINGLTANALWLLVASQHEMLGLLTLQIVLAALNVRGLYNLRRK